MTWLRKNRFHVTLNFIWLSIPRNKSVKVFDDFQNLRLDGFEMFVIFKENCLIRDAQNVFYYYGIQIY